LKAEIVKEFSFEAAHRLPGVGPDHKCSRLHGHLFKVEVAIAGEVDPELGWVMDFGDLARTAGRIISSLDHRVLNDIHGLENPTSENLSKYLYDRIAAGIPGITALTIHESPYSRCTYRPAGTELAASQAGDFRITTTEAVFSSAHYLVFPPAGREPIHGHDYRVTVTGASSRPAPGARETLNILMCEAIAPMEHKLLLAARPAVGTMSVEGGSVRIDVEGVMLVFPTTDCYIIEGVANTTTELIAFHIAEKIAKDVASSQAGFVEIEVEVLEGLDARARAVTKV
jgi:6-pyruvoyltetrahydropterin/6-carboxytetrahydropterin synthase